MSVATIQILPGQTSLNASVAFAPGAVVSFSIEVWLSFDGGLTWPKLQGTSGLNAADCPVLSRGGSQASSWSTGGQAEVAALADVANAGLLFAQARLINQSDPSLVPVLEAA